MKSILLHLTLIVGVLTHAPTLAPLQAADAHNASRPEQRQPETNVEAKADRASKPDYDLFPSEPARPTEPKPDAGTGKPTQPTPPTPETPRPAKPAPKVEIIYFTASWCAPCQRQKPILAALVKEGYKVIYIDIDQNTEMKGQYGITTIPVLVLERDGKEVKRFVGVTDKNTLKNAAQAALKPG